MTETALKIIIICSALIFYAAAIFYTIKKNKIGVVLNVLAFALNIFLVGVNWVRNGYVPFISMYQVLTFVCACFTLMLIYIFCLNKENKWMAGYFMLCSGIVMTGVFFMETPLTWLRVPALQSVWFIPHILCYMLSYTLCAVSFVICISRFFVKNEEKRELFSKGINVAVRIAFPFMTSGMLFGAIWANEIWGHFWSWDAKENWALITWLMYTIYLHCYKTKSLRKYMYIFIIAGFIALVMTLFGVNFFSSGVHAYS